MPLIKRSVEPVELSRAHVAQGIRNELECVTNNTLSNVIRQLSSLSKHAEDMFGELFHEASAVFQRANNLQERVDKLKVKVTQLDSTQDVVSLQDINMRKPFKSSVIREQQIISKRSRPPAIQETYLNSDAPPALSKLNPYREDGKDSIKFYTDATYFFELWCQQMQKDTEREKKKIKQKRPNRNPMEAKVKVREIKSKKEIYKNMKQGAEFIPQTRDYQHESYNNYQSPNSNHRPNSLEVQRHLPQHGEYIEPGHQQHMAEQQRQSMLQQNNYSNGPVSTRVTSSIPYDRPPEGSPNRYPAHQQQASSPYGTPDRTSRLTHTNSVVSPMNRPQSRPPEPPSSDMGSKSTSRESLPPPPPPPPPMEIMNTQYVSPQGQNDYSMDSLRKSPAMSIDSSHGSGSHSSVYSRGGTPSSTVNESLPPPPPSPPSGAGTPSSMSSIPPPPPPPPMDGGLHTGGGGGIPPPPPPPPPGSPPKAHMNGPVDGTGDNVSNTSSKVSGSNDKDMAAPMHDARSDLLDAIRAGINLRKVEQQEQKRDRQRRNTAGHLDVQAIMEAAFEVRRQAMERDSDEEGDSEEEDDNEWSDEDS